jgi:peptidoglycan/LPS O-acetylase OafA/YrhL
MSVSQPETKQRFYYLDSVRGVSSITLITWHFLAAYNGPDNNGLTTTSPWHFFWYGEGALVLFFLHSGFILSYSYTGNDKPLTVSSYIRFLIERIFRIYPLFVFMLLVSFLLKSTIFPLTNGAFTSEHLHIFWNHKYDLLSVFKEAILFVAIPEEGSMRLIPQDWTLTVEIIVGALIPFMAFLLKKSKWVFWIAIFTSIMLLRLSTFIFEFSCGVFLFYHWQIIKEKWRNMNIVFKIIIFILTVWLYFCLFHFCSLFNYSLVLFRPGVDRFIVVSGCCLVFCIVISSSVAQKILLQPLFVKIGRICYSIYLVHMILLICFADYFMLLLHKWIRLSDFNYFLIAFIVFIVLTILISFVTYSFIEKPYNAMGKKISQRAQRFLDHIKLRIPFLNSRFF